MSTPPLNRVAFPILGSAVALCLAMSACWSTRTVKTTSNTEPAAPTAADRAATTEALRKDDGFWEIEHAAVSIPAVGATPAMKRQQLLNKFRELRISVNFEDTHLHDAITFFSDYSAIPITVASDVDTKKKISKFRLSQVRLQEAFNLLLANAGLTYTFRGHELHVGRPSTLKLRLLFGVYRVSDILANVHCSHCPPLRVKNNEEDDEGGASPFSFDESDTYEQCIDASTLRDLVVESTGGEEHWESTGSTIEVNLKQLLINSTLELHLAVRTCLSDLRGAP